MEVTDQFKTSNYKEEQHAEQLQSYILQITKPPYKNSINPQGVKLNIQTQMPEQIILYFVHDTGNCKLFNQIVVDFSSTIYIKQQQLGRLIGWSVQSPQNNQNLE